MCTFLYGRKVRWAVLTSTNYTPANICQTVCLPVRKIHSYNLRQSHLSGSQLSGLHSTLTFGPKYFEDSLPYHQWPVAARGRGRPGPTILEVANTLPTSRTWLAAIYSREKFSGLPTPAACSSSKRDTVLFMCVSVSVSADTRASSVSGVVSPVATVLLE